MAVTINLQRQYRPDSQTVPDLLLAIFGGNPYHARSRDTAGSTSFVPIQQPLTEELLQSHLDGKVTLGSYPVLKEDQTVRWLGWDVDSADRSAARRMAVQILSRIKHLPHAVEFSGSKGYHILLFLSEPLPAEKAKAISEYVRESEGLAKSGESHVECYPKQGVLTKSNPMGNLLKIPLGLHPKSHDRSRFIDPDNGWEAGPDCDPLQILTHRITAGEAMSLMRIEGNPLDQIIELLTPQWTALAGEHHNMALYLSGYLAHLGWGFDDVKTVMEKIATNAGDNDVANRIQAVKDTFRSLEDGKSVKGFTGLNELLPGAVMRSLIEYATRAVTPTWVQRVDGIRLAKMPPQEKVRTAAALIWSDLNERGEVIKTQENLVYWFNTEEHWLLPFGDIRWEAFLHHNYGINPKENFGVQLTKAVHLIAVQSARTVQVHNRTVWTGKELYINLGQAEVYKLDGHDIQTLYNGECGYLFKTDDLLREPITPDWANPIDIWDLLIKDLSFNKSADAPATPEEQGELLKAWLLSFFFQELMPTKPLLLALGVPGSGKTTAMRRILRIIEGPDAEVLEVTTDKPDSLRASLAHHSFLVLDNLEKSGAKWLVDMLNRLATGAAIELRQLYATNGIYVLKPRCFIAMTAVSMPFSEETLFSRILPLEMAQINSPQPEHMIQKKIANSINGVWADLLLKLNQIVDTLNRDQTQVPPIASRLADFTVFCKRIEKSGVVDGKVLIKGLRSLVDRQKNALLASSPFVAVLEEWMLSASDEAAKPHTFVQLFSILEPIARMKKLAWRWENAQALARHVMTMAEPLKKLYRAQFTVDNSSGKDVDLVKFPKSV